MQVANANMADAVRLISIRRGYDPREFALVAFGGAGPLHGAALAAELSIPTVMVPPSPGVTSALGCLLVDMRHDLATMYLRRPTMRTPPRSSRSSPSSRPRRAERLRAEGVRERTWSCSARSTCAILGQWRSLAVPGRTNMESLDEAIGHVPR